MTEQVKEIADECVKSLLPASDLPSESRMTKLFNRPIFEYSANRGQLQVLVYFIDDIAEKSLRSIIQPKFELFYHRHKITKAFIDSRTNHDLAHEIYLKIENNIEGLETKLALQKKQYLPDLKIDIKQLLHDSLRYQKTLQFLEDFDNTISIHIYNYQQKLAEISYKCKIQLEELITFTLFIEKTSPYLQKQIKADLGYFQHGTDLVETAIASIRGIVEIEQAERDRSLERTIEILAAGLGAGGIVASAVSGHIDKPLVIKIPQAGDRIHPGVSSLLFSFLFALVVGGVVGLINGKFRLHGTIAKIFNYILGHSK